MILNESGRDDLLLPYLEILKNKGINCKLGVLKRYLLKHFVEDGDFRNLSLGSNFYLAGVAKYYFNGDLTSNKNLAVFDETDQTQDIWNEDICKRLNALILILRNSVVDSVGETFEQPEDFGDLPLPKLLRKYGAKINKVLGIVTVKKEKEDTLDRNESVGNDYTFEILYSYEDGTKYYRPTSPGAWCITYGTNHYNYYKNRLGIHYVIFKKNGWENVPRQKGPEWTSAKPQDEYGCSLIALLQSDTTGEPVYITSRWNHGSEPGTHCEADHAFTKEEFFQKTGVTDADLQRILQIWKKDKSSRRSAGGGQAAEVREKNLYNLRDLKYRQMRINGGENPDLVMISIPRDMEDPNERQMYVERHKFTIIGNGKPNKSIISYTIEIEGVKYRVLVDKGRILYESLVPNDEYRQMGSWRATYEYTDRMDDTGKRRVSNLKWLRNMIVIRLKGDKYKLYDIRRHQFLDIGGVTTFKYIDNARDWQSENAIFYEVKLTNRQIALVDSNTNTPLKLPNGQYWCEEIKYEGQQRYYGREVRPGFIKEGDVFLVMVYDSSARQIFFYNLKQRKFENIDISSFNNTDYINVKSAKFSDPSIISVENNGWQVSHRQGFFMKDGKKVAIGNIVGFSNCRRYDDFLTIQLLPTPKPEPEPTTADHDVTDIPTEPNMAEENQICWLEEYQSFLMDGSEPLTFIEVEFARNVYRMNEAKYVFFRRTYDLDSDYYDNSRYTYAIYSKEHKSFFINPDTGNINFQMGYIGYGHKDETTIELRTNPDGERYGQSEANKKFTYEDLIAKGLLKPAIVPNSAPLHTIDRNGQEGQEMTDAVNERIEINTYDIKQMILEAFNKIKNEE